MKNSFFKKLKSTFNFSYLALLVLFCFAISTSYMSLSYMAKYSTYAGSNPDSARNAEFNVGINFEKPNTYEMKLEMEEWQDWHGEFPFTVTNNSEVTVKCSVKVEFDQVLPVGVTFGIPEMNNVWHTGYYNQKKYLFEVTKDKWFDTTTGMPKLDSDGQPMEDESILLPNQTKKMNLTFWPQKSIAVTFDTQARVTVIVEQVD